MTAVRWRNSRDCIDGDKRNNDFMCSILTHSAVPIALSACFPEGTVSPQLVFAGIACSAIPDLDVIGFSLGIGYDNMLGHRGLTHSVAFAVALAACVGFTVFRDDESGFVLPLIFLFLSTLSHPLLDMLTNGGRGIALWAPFSHERFFFPWRPIQVSPIGLGFFSERGIRVLLSEFRWVWLPATAVFISGSMIRRFG
jgi:inner membrane protein